MRKLKIDEIVMVSGAGPEELTDVGAPQGYAREGTYEFIMRDCALATSGGIGTGACGNAIQTAIAAEREAENETGTDDQNELEGDGCQLESIAYTAQIAINALEARATGFISGLSYSAEQAAAANLIICLGLD